MEVERSFVRQLVDVANEQGTLGLALFVKKHNLENLTQREQYEIWDILLSFRDSVPIADIKQFIRINAKGVDGHPIIYDIATNSHEYCSFQNFITLVENGAEVNFVKDGVPLLISCILSGITSYAKVIIERARKIDLNARDHHGKTTLMYISSRGNHEFAAFLVAKGASIKIRDKRGKTALDHVRSYYPKDRDGQQKKALLIKLLTSQH